MWFLPYLKEDFSSPLAPAELLRRVQASISPPRPWSWHDLFFYGRDEPFQGLVGGHYFKLVRNITYRGSPPRISGHVHSNPKGPGSIVELRHRPQTYELVFGIILLVLLSIITTFIFSSATLAELIILPLAMLTFGAVFIILPFWYEVRKSRPLLVDLLLLTETAAA